jgi:uncharacterized protein YqeY
MSYQDRIQADVKDAMRAGDAETRDTLRMVMAGLKNKRIELGRDLDEKDQLQVLQKQKKSREDSLAQYGAAGRAHLAAREQAEIAVIDRYLPATMSDDDVRALVAGAIAASGASSKADLGKVMKTVMAENQGKVDGKTVQRIAAELLP